jgi:2-haloacid dehalogenase
MAQAHGCRYIATAHHADDQLETVLMRLIRGAGPRGMGGIRAVRSLGQEGPEGRGVRVVRPMLGMSRDEAVRICTDAEWVWREDASNRDESFLRNAIRARVIPEIKAIRPDAAERAAFFATVCTHDWNLEQDRGRSWPEGEAVLVAQFPDREAEIRAFRQHWAEMVPHAYDDSVAIMTELIDAGRDVTMLTNFAADTYVEAGRLFPFLDLPRGVTVSGRIGLIKPDTAIYDRHAREFGLEPRRTVFIDDRRENIVAAQARGWRAVQHEGVDSTLRALRALGIDTG